MSAPTPLSRSALGLAGLLAALLVSLALSAGEAKAAAPIYQFEAAPTTTQAGGHPDVFVRFLMENRNSQEEVPCFCNSAKDITVSLPTGVIGDPHAVPACSAAEFARLECPPESQVGIQGLLFGGNPDAEGFWILTPLYNVKPSTNQAGLLAFNAPLIPGPIFIELSPRTGSDYGLDATVAGTTQFALVWGITQVFWGVPADPSHDGVRYPRGEIGGICPWPLDPLPFIFGDPAVIPDFCAGGTNYPEIPSNSAPKALLSNPTNCEQDITANIAITAYDGETSHASTPWPPTVGCDQLGFNPSLSAQPTTKQTDTASGLDVNLKVPQSEAPSSPATSEIRGVRVTLPEGFSINPNAADGKQTCSDAQANFGTELAAQCPQFSKVGSLTINTPALPGPLPGYIYLGEPLLGNRYRLIIAADGFAVHVKLAGTVRPDPSTGRLKVSFEDLPQTTFSEFDMHFFGSERGLLATPTRCGTYQVDTEFVPWAEELPNQTSTQFFALDSGPGGSGCPGATRPTQPSLSAGVTDNNAGSHTRFTLNMGRRDGDQIVDRLNVKLPPGFAAKLRGVPYCPPAAIAAARSGTGTAELASSSCPAASQIGGLTVGVGAGNHPLYVPGRAFLAGPHAGSPLSLVVVVPAVSGPYDLGNVVVHTALAVNSTTAQVTALSDSLPRILDGIPLRIRSLMVNLDRPSFALNPTNCDPFAVELTVFGEEGGVGSAASRFQVGNCAILPFAPKLAIKLRGGLNRRGHPALSAVLTAPEGSANIARTVVTMPADEQLDNAHIGTVCTRVQFAADNCPAGSLLGTAEALTPLLDQPLRGNVYLRSSSNKLPDLVADLEGQIDIELAGKIDSSKAGGLRTSFNGVPDAPVTRFVLSLEGGKKGLLINSKSLCNRPYRAKVTMTGQNGMRTTSNNKLQTACGGKGKRPRRNKRGGAR